MSKESDSLSFNENLFTYCVEERNISRTDFVAFPGSARLYHQRVIFINGIFQKSS